MNKSRIFAFLVALIGFGISSTASAYQYLYTCGPTWKTLPITYYINQNGSADMPFGTLEQVIDASYQAWETPCCSKFRAQYGGTTANTAMDNNNKIVLSFQESGWDPQFGSVNVTIGVTLTSVWNDCSIADAPILFNGVGFTFSNNGSQTGIEVARVVPPPLWVARYEPASKLITPQIAHPNKKPPTPPNKPMPAASPRKMLRILLLVTASWWKKAL